MMMMNGDGVECITGVLVLDTGTLLSVGTPRVPVPRVYHSSVDMAACYPLALLLCMMVQQATLWPFPWSWTLFPLQWVSGLLPPMFSWFVIKEKPLKLSLLLLTHHSQWDNDELWHCHSSPLLPSEWGLFWWSIRKFSSCFHIMKVNVVLPPIQVGCIWGHQTLRSLTASDGPIWRVRHWL